MILNRGFLIGAGVFVSSGVLGFTLFTLVSSPPDLLTTGPVVKAMPPPPSSPIMFQEADDEALNIMLQNLKGSIAPADLTVPDQRALPSTSLSYPAYASSPALQESEVESSKPESAFAYTILLESFSNPSNAEKRVQFLQSLGLEAFAHRVALPTKGVFHRVFIGRFADRMQVGAVQARLKEEFSLPMGKVISASALDD